MSTNELLGERKGGVTGDEGKKEEKGVKDALEAMVLIGCQEETFQFPPLHLIVFTSISPFAPHSAPPPLHLLPLHPLL